MNIPTEYITKTEDVADQVSFFFGLSNIKFAMQFTDFESSEMSFSSQFRRNFANFAIEILKVQ